MNKETEQVFLINAPTNQPSTSTQKPNKEEMPGTSGSQANAEDAEDMSHVCRTCASVTESVVPIFSGEGLQNNLADKIHEHLPIRVRKSDVLPVVLCYQCASTLLAWHELVQCCLQADAALRQRVRHVIREAAKAVPSGLEEEELSKLFCTNVKNILDEYFHNILEEKDLDVDIVCQKCVEKPALTNANGLADHIKYEHSSDISITDYKTIKTFITNYITFEQVLAEDSDREIQSVTIEEPGIILPSLYCPFCASVFSSSTRLVYHLNKHVEVCIADGVMCCDVMYNNKKQYVQHLQESHVNRTSNDSEVVCIKCDFTTEGVNELKDHYKEMHNDLKSDKEKKVESPNNQKYIPAVCPECNKTFSNKYNMFVHMRSHTDTTLFACDKCTKTYRNQGSLHNHKRMAHEGILNFLCLECCEAFPSRSERDIHSRIHTGEKPFKCEQCGNSYRSKNTLTRHLDIHLNIRKYECKICSKKFRKKSHLDYHIQTHMK